VTLNEECGFIQWVPRTVPIRPVLTKTYDARGVKSWACILDSRVFTKLMISQSPDLLSLFDQIKSSSDKDAGRIFIAKVLPLYVLHSVPASPAS
jgi:serine/threonine-protein kinase ATR